MRNKKWLAVFNIRARESHKRKAFFYTAAIALCCIMGLYACKNDAGKTQGAVIPATSVAPSQSTDTLQAALDAARSQIDILMSQKSESDSMSKNEIAKLESELNHYKKLERSYAVQLKRAKGLMKTLKNDAREYAGRLGILQDYNNSLSKTRDSLEQSYTDLEELGSVLHASNIRLTAYNLKHRGRKEKETERARKTKLLRVKFDIDLNRIAENGIKKLYLVIKGPDGNLLNDGNNNAGTTKSSAGGTIAYSVSKEVALKRNEPVKDVTVDWKQKADYKKGNYDIEIYNSGYEIGDGTVRLN